MYPTPSPNEYQQRKDDDQIKLLALFHFIFGGLALVGIGFLVLHYYFMSSFINDPQMWQQLGEQAIPKDNPFPGGKPFPNGNPFPKEFVGMFVWFYFFMGAMLLLGGLANIFSGIFLRQRKLRMFSLVVAGMNCLQVPFGTALGVCTFVVLLRDSVRQSYGEY